MNPNENPLGIFNKTSIVPGYILERPMSTGCTLDKSSNATKDNRYQRVSGFEISEYDLFQQNGVLYQLQSLPGYS